METKKEIQKTQVFNVIILDRSGSMGCIRRAAVDGVNETLAGIKKAQEKFADTQGHFVSLVTFCSCETKRLYDNTPVAEANPLKIEDFQPCCSTPLYDAMGFTLTRMHRHVQGLTDAMVVVTIITDGMENASREYNGKNLWSDFVVRDGHSPIWEPIKTLLRLPCLCLSAMHEISTIATWVHVLRWRRTTTLV